jgi:exodeoxyribonuclease-3
MKLVSWNVNGIRAIAKKGFSDHIKALDPDILCLQETKINEQHPIISYPYQSWAFAQKKGYSGTAIFSKTKPLSVVHEMPGHDSEGRIICAEFDKYYIVTVYTPNSQRGLARLEYRQTWDSEFRAYVQKKNKPVIICGDLNVAHQPMDLANPKSNYNKTAGYTQKEIDGFTQLLNAGYIDTFRTLHPTQITYSWWSHMFQARAKNIGWRIDYVLADTRLQQALLQATIHDSILGSDHCPVSAEFDEKKW